MKWEEPEVGVRRAGERLGGLKTEAGQEVGWGRTGRGGG